MVTLISIEGYGIIAVDLNGNIVWEWTYAVETKGRIAGFDFDKKTGSIYVAGFTEVLEINKRGKVLWRYSHPELVDLHSLQLLSNGNILVASAANDRVVEINKKEGIVWRWLAKNHFSPPEGYVNHEDWRSIDLSSDWTHLNHAWETENGDRLISLYKLGKVVRVDKGGKILWSWGDHVLKGAHYVIPLGDGYLIADSGNNRVIEVAQNGVVVKEFTLGVSRPRGLEVLSNGNILVANTLIKNVVEIDKNDKVIWNYELPQKIQELRNPNPYTAKRIEKWNYREDSAIIERRLKALGYID